MNGDYWWFQGQTVEKLTEKLIAAGPGAILKCTPHGDKLFLEVVAPDGHGHDPLDDSHVCPPQCP